MSGLRTKAQDTKLLGINVIINEDIFCSPTKYSLKETSFRLHPVWGTHPAQPVVTIAEVLPLCPSWINGNLGHKYKSQATQHGHILSHIDAYNGEEKAHTEEERICDRQEAMKVIIFSFRIGSPQVWWAHIVRQEWSEHPHCLNTLCEERKRSRKKKWMGHS